MRITKRIEFDSGHRIPEHTSKCRHFHGHRYILEATVEGNIKPVRGESDDGMVMDFGDIKKLMTEYIHDPWDHAFIVFAGDAQAREALAVLGTASRVVVLGCVPTAENLAVICFNILAEKFAVQFDGVLWLDHIRLFETPNSWADVYIEDYSEKVESRLVEIGTPLEYRAVLGEKYEPHISRIARENDGDWIGDTEL